MFGKFLPTLVAGLLLTSCSVNEVVPPTTAKGYLDLGFLYKQRGWSEKARFALQKAVEMDRNSSEGKAAAVYLRARIPKFPVSEAAETENINAYNLSAAGQNDAAAKAFKLLIAKYPKFEWPYGNLAAIYVEEGKYQDAVTLLKKVLTINPDYYVGWIHLADAYRGLNNEVEVSRCQQRALTILPKEYQDAGY